MMARTLRQSTQDKTRASADAANNAGYVRKPKAPPTRRQLYARNKGLISMKTPEQLQHITSANTDSPLLRLPPEIRNIISKYATTHRWPSIGLYYNRQGHESRSGTSTRCLQWFFSDDIAVHLPQVCRQIYSETATMIYAENTFAFTTEKGLWLWLGRRLRAQREAIRNIEMVTMEIDTARVEKRTRKLCPNLHSMTVHRERAMFLADLREDSSGFEGDDVDFSTDDDWWEEDD